jgi:hypothetical protein
VIRKNSILIALDVAAPNRDNRQEQPSMPQREALAMTRLMRLIRQLGQLTCTLLMLLGDGGRYIMLRRSGSPTSCGSSLACACRHAPCASKCPSASTVV